MLLSIITVAKEDRLGLRQTAKSLSSLRKGGLRFEWILIEHQVPMNNCRSDTQVPETYEIATNIHVREPDNGIYDAMNKGIRLSAGKFLWFLNSGDESAVDTDFGGLISLLSSSDSDLLLFRCRDRDARGREIERRPRSIKWLRFGMPVSHQAMLFRRAFQDGIRYSDAYRLAGDYELVTRLIHNGASTKTIDIPLALVQRGGRSETNRALGWKEEGAIRTKYFGAGKIENAVLRIIKELIWQCSRLYWLRRLWRERI